MGFMWSLYTITFHCYIQGVKHLTLLGIGCKYDCLYNQELLFDILFTYATECFGIRSNLIRSRCSRRKLRNLFYFICFALPLLKLPNKLATKRFSTTRSLPQWVTDARWLNTVIATSWGTNFEGISFLFPCFLTGAFVLFVQIHMLPRWNIWKHQWNLKFILVSLMF